MIEVELIGVSVDVASNTPIVVLQELTGSSRSLSIFIGGPEATAIAFALEGVQAPRPLTHDLFKDVLEAVAAGRGPERLLVTLGYAGWGPGQLESEIGQNAWLTMPADPGLVFDIPADARFAEAYRMLGIDPLLIAPRAGHA